MWFVGRSQAPEWRCQISSTEDLPDSLKIVRLMAIQRQNWIAFRNSLAQRSRFHSYVVQIILILLAVFLFSAGCVRLPTTTPEAPVNKRAQASRLIKVLRPPDRPEDEWRQWGSIPARQGQPGQSRQPKVRLASRASAEAKKLAPQTEESQVQAAARELARRIGSIDGIKMCYVDNDDEWWATFYEDIGTVIDVRQFIWNRGSQRFEPFLVLKRISKRKLAAELNRKDKGRRCSVLPPPEKSM
jgi:hypothetical protein